MILKNVVRSLDSNQENLNDGQHDDYLHYWCLCNINVALRVVYLILTVAWMTWWSASIWDSKADVRAVSHFIARRSCHNGVTTHTCSDPVTAIVFALNSLTYMFLMKRIITQLNRSRIHANIQWCQVRLKWIIFISIKCPASAVLMYYAVLITGGTYRSLVTPLWQDRPLLLRYPNIKRS